MSEKRYEMKVSCQNCGKNQEASLPFGIQFIPYYFGHHHSGYLSKDGENAILKCYICGCAQLVKLND